MAFWGVEVKPGKTFTLKNNEATGIRRLHLSQATLGHGTATNRSILQCNVGNKSPLLLCVLTPDKVDSCQLNLEFEETDEVIFSVIGPRSVHLTGYFLGRSTGFRPNDDESESFGEDIVDTDMEKGSSDDYDYSDSFINDDDPAVRGSHVSSTDDDEISIKEMTAKTKEKKKNGKGRRLRKKFQVSDSDSDETSARADESSNEDSVEVLNNGNEPKIAKVHSSESPLPSRVTRSKARKSTLESGEPAKCEKTFEAKINTHKTLDNREDKPLDDAKLSPVQKDCEILSKKKRNKERSKSSAIIIDSDDGEGKNMPESLQNENPVSDKGIKSSSDVLLSQNGDATLSKKKKKRDRREETTDVPECPEKKKQAIDKNIEKEAGTKKPLETRTLSNGVIIEDIEKGKLDGKSAVKGKKVSILYTGKLKDTGNLFDSNLGEDPLRFRLGGENVIEGLSIGVEGMRVGDKRRLIIPPALGYSKRGLKEKVPKSAWLVYEVEAVKIMRSPRSGSIEELSQRLESKLNAAEQKRLSILEKELARLAKMDEARQAAKNGLEQRVEKERDELESKVEERVLKAEKNRMLLFKAMAQRRAAKRQRAAQSLMKKAIQETRYKESVRAAIYQKRAAAESKRMGILEAERRRANARLTRVFGAASSVRSQKEAERRKMKDRLEERLQRAKKLKAQYMRRRRGMDSCSSSRSETMRKNQVHLVRMLVRCWRRFAKYKKSTFVLARAYHELGINEKSIESVPFEQFAIQMNSVSVIQTVKALLDRLEIRLTLSKASNVENINHLLKHIFPPVRRGKSPSPMSKGEQNSPNSKMGYQKLKKIARYPARIFLCAYMIKQHPGAIFRGRGEHEIALVESATCLIREFELLVKVILEGPESTLPGNVSFVAQRPKKFRSQLEAFDKAWCSYLEGFVVWKINDAKLLEKDLARTQESELSEVSKHTSSPKIIDSGLNQKTVKASSPTNRALFSETDGARESKAPADSHLPSSSSPSPGSSNLSPSLNSGSEAISTPNVVANSFDAALASENEVIVNEIVHDNSSSFADSLDPNTGDTSNLQVRVKETMEKAFWDGVMESMKQSQPDFSWVIKLMKEVRDELCEISPKDWRQEIVQTIDTDVLSQLLASGNVDMGYLGNILEFSLGILLKLSAPANEEEIRVTHHKLMTELGEIVPTDGHSNSSYAVLMVKGLRFVLQQIQILKKEISKSRLKLLEPLLKGPAGLEYLKKSFSSRHGSPDQASSSLPLTKRWLLSVRGEAEREWKEHKDALSAVINNHSGSSGLPSTTMRTGGNVSSVSKVNTPSSPFPGIELSECKGETVDLLVRIGLLKMVSEIGGLTLETVPETFQLNLSRLRDVQSQIQKITLVSISVLILQQTLVSENSSSIDMEAITRTCINRLYEMLDAKPDAGLSEIMETLSELLDSNDAETKKQVIANMLVKSLQAGDAVFTHVSQTIYLAIRAAVLAGNNTKRKQLVETMLRKIGAASLSDKVIEVSDILVLVATVSRSVHGLWYEELLKKPN